MKKKFIPIILVSLSITLFTTAIVIMTNSNYFLFKNETNNKDTNQNGVKDEQEKLPSDVKQDNNEETKNDENENKNETESTDKKTVTEDNKVETEKPTTNDTITEESVISYFSTREKSITESTNQNDRTLREKAKDTFITVVDFIFYDKEIKGYTFKELTTSAKLKVIEIALSIDHKIDEYFPDYKDVIKDKYNDIKGKLAVKYLEFTSTLCEKVGKDTCNQAKEDFNTMKESFGFTWELIKELAKSGSDKVKEFYENWRDS